MNTELIYLEDSYLSRSVGKVLSVDTNKNQTVIVLDQTIFSPAEGGQLSDLGTIAGRNGTLQVSNASLARGLVEHHGELQGSIKIGEQVELVIDWEHRYEQMQVHTATQLLYEAVKEIMPEYHQVTTNHGSSSKHCVQFSGLIDATEKPAIQQALNELIQLDEPIQSKIVSAEEIESEGIFVAANAPSTTSLRVISLGDRDWRIDHETQLARTGESWPIRVTEFSHDDGMTTIKYRIQQPTANKPSMSKINNKPESLLEQFEADLSELVLSVSKETTLTQEHKALILGKKGQLQAIAARMRDLPQADRSQAGKALNKAKRQLTTHFEHTKSTADSDTNWVDVTRPGKLPAIGHLHPITQAIEEIQRIFEGIGFTRVRYPEIDWDHYVFEALNMPQSHPARDEWETFFMEAPEHSVLGKLVLTTHTSNGQVREMERVGEPPIRMLNIAKCYRRQQDVTHTAMFHQFEGLVIDKGITIQHLKGSLDHFAKKFYGPSAKSRIRPFMFKFTEPSFEVDFSCTHCDGKGEHANGEKCRFCKAGWHEVGGAGMVHPNVLRAGGIDPDVYTGFAFGWGVERVYTLNPGLELDDIRPLYGNNVEFLAKF